MLKALMLAAVLLIGGCYSDLEGPTYEWDTQAQRCRNIKSGQFADSELCAAVVK